VAQYRRAGMYMLHSKSFIKSLWFLGAFQNSERDSLLLHPPSPHEHLSFLYTNFEVLLWDFSNVATETSLACFLLVKKKKLLTQPFFFLWMQRFRWSWKH
jgi:hypothetical protein